MLVVNNLSEEIIDKISNELMNSNNCFIDITDNTVENIIELTKANILKRYNFKVKIIAFIADGTKYTLHIVSKKLNLIQSERIFNIKNC